MTVKGFKRGQQFYWQAERIEGLARRSPFLWKLLANVLPKIQELRRVAAWDVVSDRHTQQFHDATLNGVHQGEVDIVQGNSVPSM